MYLTTDTTARLQSLLMRPYESRLPTTGVYCKYAAGIGPLAMSGHGPVGNNTSTAPPWSSRYPTGKGPIVFANVSVDWSSPVSRPANNSELRGIGARVDFFWQCTSPGRRWRKLHHRIALWMCRPETFQIWVLEWRCMRPSTAAIGGARSDEQPVTALSSDPRKRLSIVTWT